MATTIHPPAPGDYAAYYNGYISQVPQGAILDILKTEGGNAGRLYQSIPESKLDFRYAEGNWTVKQIFGHVIDTERVMAYRALRIARGDSTELPGFDQDVFVAHAPHARMPMSELLEEFVHVRNSSIALLRTFDEAAWDREGIASKNKVTVRALAWIIAGHEMWHRKIVNERYLGV